MGMFSGMKEAQVGQGGVYFTDGSYVVEVTECIAKKSRKGDSLYIVEARVLEGTTSPTVRTNAKGAEETIYPKKAGTKASWVVNMRHDAALGNIKGFLAAAIGCDEDQIGEEEAEESVSADNPLAGMIVRLDCETIITQNKNDFTLHRWSTYEEDNDGE